MKHGHPPAEQHHIASDLCSLPEELHPCLMKLARRSESPLVVAAVSRQWPQLHGDFAIGADQESQLAFARELLHCLAGDTTATLDACDCHTIDEQAGHITRIFELHIDGVPLYRCGVSLGSVGEVVRSVSVVVPSVWPGQGKWTGEAVARRTVERHRGLQDVPADWVLGRGRRMWFSAAITHGTTHGVPGEPDWVPAWGYSTPPANERPIDVVVAADGSALVATIALGDITLGLAPLPRFHLRPESDVPAFISWGQAGLLLPAAGTGDAATVARSLFDRFPTLFGTGDPARQLQLVRTDVSSSWPRTRHVVFQQIYGGVPVHGCQLRVHLAPDLAIRCVTGCYLRDPQVSLDVKVGEAQARATLPGRVENTDDRKGRTNLPVTANGLVVFPAVLAPRGGAVNHLAWWFTTPEHHYFISAESGRHVYALPAQQDARYTYDANRMTSSETLDVQDGRTVTAGGMAPDTDSVPMDSAVGMFEGFLLSLFGWHGWNGGGADHIAIVDYPADNNAFWSSWDHRVRFDRNFTTRPIVGHEFAHGVTEATCNLVYVGEPGALNESFSDVMGKLAFPGTPPDWQVLLNDGTSIRDLAAPTVGRYSLLNNAPLDHFGVHANSGIGNRCAVLFCDGDGTPAHPAAGRELTARLWWDLQTLFLHPWSRYMEFSLVMRQLVRDFAAAGTMGVAAPASAAAGGAPLPVFDGASVAAADAALRAVELSPLLHSGWFTIPGIFSRTYTFFGGGLVPATEVVSAAEVLAVRQRDADRSQFLFGRAVSPSAPTYVDQSGTLVVKITADGVGTRSKQMTVDVLSTAGVETELTPTVYTTAVAPAPAAPPLEISEWTSPVIAHWFDNPFFAGRRYGDLIYETVGVDAATCSILDVWLEILERKNGQYLPRGQARLGGPAVTWGGTGVTLVEAHPGTALLETKVRSWHDFGQCVRYRIVYVISGGCIPTAFGSRAVDPFTFV